jgi:hypothetical protein
MRKQNPIPRNLVRAATLGVAVAAAFAVLASSAHADKTYWYWMHGYAGWMKVGPFTSEDECMVSVNNMRAENYVIDGCISEGTDSSTSSPSTSTTTPSTPAEALAQGITNGMAAAQALREKQKAAGQAAYKASAENGKDFYEGQKRLGDDLIEQDDNAERAKIADQQAQDLAQEEAERADTLGKIKDDAGDIQLKDGSTPFFGFKVVSPSEAARMINTQKPTAATNDLSTAWKQLNCASDIAHHVLAKVKNMDTAGADERSLDDVSFLAQQSVNALSGATVDVSCSPAPAAPSGKQPDLAQIAPQYKQVLSRAVDDAKKLYDIQQAEQAAQQKLEAAKAAAAASSTSKQAAAGSDSDAIAKAVAEQDAWRAKDQQNINAVYAQQKQMQQQNSDALAALRAAQLQLNKENSEKVSVEDDLDKLSGELPQN